MGQMNSFLRSVSQMSKLIKSQTSVIVSLCDSATRKSETDQTGLSLEGTRTGVVRLGRELLYEHSPDSTYFRVKYKECQGSVLCSQG